MLGKREELWTRTVSKVASGKRALPNGGGAGFHWSASEKSSGRGRRAGAASGKRPVATGDFCLFFELGRSLGLFVFEFESFLSN